MSEKIVILGQLGAPYGVKGWIHIRSYTEPETNLFSYEDWLVYRFGQWQPTKHLDWGGNTKHRVVRLLGCEDRQTAASMTQCPIGVYRHHLEPLPEQHFYWADLEGLEVMAEVTGLSLGHVYSLRAMPTYDALVVKQSGSSKSFFIPFILDETIVRVDLDQKRIWVQHAAD